MQWSLTSHLDLRLFDLGWWVITGFPNMPQKPQPANLGEGGSMVGGEFLSVRYACSVLDRLRSNNPIDPTLRDGLSSLNSTSSLACWVAFILLMSPDRNLSFQTKPEDPCLLKDVVDLCNPDISLFLSLSLCVRSEMVLDWSLVGGNKKWKCN